MAKRSRNSFEVLKPCPICHTMLRRGERLHTVVYTGGGRRADGGGAPDGGSRGGGPQRGGTRRGVPQDGGFNEELDTARTPEQRTPDRNAPRRDEDTLTHIFGCPYCYPPDDEHPRYCPVCERKLGAEDYVIARMFNRAPRSHVHVLGCTQCRGPGSRARR